MVAAPSRKDKGEASDRRVRVVFLAYSLSTGGAEKQLSVLARHIDQTRFDPHVLTFHGGGSLESELIDSGIVPTTANKSSRTDIIGFAGRLVASLKRIAPDIVYSFMDYPNVVSEVLRPCAGRYRTVWGLRSSDNHPASQDRTWRTIFAAGRYLSRFPDAFVSNSYAGKAYYRSMGYPEARIRVIENGIDTNRFIARKESRSGLRSAWQVDEKTVIGFLARLHPKKDAVLFIKAAEIVAADTQHTHFVIAGDDSSSYGQEVRALAGPLVEAGRLTWLGAQRDTVGVLSALDIFAQSSAYGEGFSNALGEAMAVGLPVIATDVGDSARILGTPDWIVPPADATAFAGTLRTMAMMPCNERGRIGKKNKSRIGHSYPIKRMVVMSEELLEKIARGLPC